MVKASRPSSDGDDDDRRLDASSDEVADSVTDGTSPLEDADKAPAADDVDGKDSQGNPGDDIGDDEEDAEGDLDDDLDDEDLDDEDLDDDDLDDENLDDDLDDEDLDTDGPDAVAATRATKRGARKSATATAKKPVKAKADKQKTGSSRAAKTRSDDDRGIPAYLRQVGSEMSKVVWPTRKQMITYTSVVIVFVVFLVGMVWGFDLGVGKLMDLVFG